MTIKGISLWLVGILVIAGLFAGWLLLRSQKPSDENQARDSTIVLLVEADDAALNTAAGQRIFAASLQESTGGQTGPLIAALKNGSGSPAARAVAIVALGKLTKNDDDIRALCGLYGEARSKAEKIAVVQALVTRRVPNDVFYERFKTVLRNPEVKELSVEVGQIVSPDAAKCVFKSYEDGQGTTVNAALIRCLGFSQTRVPAITDMLLKLLEKPQRDYLQEFAIIAALAQTKSEQATAVLRDRATRYGADPRGVLAMAALAEQDTALSVTTALELLGKTKDLSDYVGVLQALAQTKEPSTSAKVDGLLKDVLLSSPSSRVRGYVAVAISAREPEFAREVLKSALTNEKDDNVKADIQRGLDIVGEAQKGQKAKGQRG